MQILQLKFKINWLKFQGPRLKQDGSRRVPKPNRDRPVQPTPTHIAERGWRLSTSINNFYEPSTVQPQEKRLHSLVDKGSGYFSGLGKAPLEFIRDREPSRCPVLIIQHRNTAGSVLCSSDLPFGSDFDGLHHFGFFEGF
jgi:hypothetical protein